MTESNRPLSLNSSADLPIPVAAPIADLAEDNDHLPRRPLQWFLLMLTAALVGAVAGLIGGCFRLALVWANHYRVIVADFAHAHSSPAFGWSIPTALCALGAGAGCWLTQRFAPETAGSGIPRVEAVLRTHLRPAGARLLPIKFIGGTLAIGSGLALGREGPTVQMGGILGRLIGEVFRRYVQEPWTLLACGAGAGLAVAFNAPLAAALFVMEELVHRFSARVFSATLVACITGTVVLRAMLGNATDFHVAPFGSVPADVLPEYLLLGILAGLLGVVFNKSLLATLQLFDKASHWPYGAKGALVGAAAGILLWFDPSIVGGGENVAEAAIVKQLAWSTLCTLLFIRFFLTMASYGCGAPGGIFAPLLALGALLGNAFAAGSALLNHVSPSPSAYAIVAMAACFTAVVRSPLTGVVLLLEMTGSWTLILPMMAASVTAYAVPELLGTPPIYDSLRERDEASEKRKLMNSI